LDAWEKLYTNKIKIPTRRLKKYPHRQLMRSGLACQKEGIINKYAYYRDEFHRLINT
jgi:hypothetical protein